MNAAMLNGVPVRRFGACVKNISFCHVCVKQSFGNEFKPSCVAREKGFCKSYFV